MHSRELVELAALIVAQHDSASGRDYKISDAVAAEYWTASKARLDGWHARIRDLTRPDFVYDSKARLRPVLEEIVVSEMLTRVWSAVGAVLDDYAGVAPTSSIHSSILTAHTELSNRLHTALLKGRLPAAATKSLNGLRRLTERWTDLLLGRLNAPHIVGRFACDAARAADFADDCRGECSLGNRQQSWRLLRVSLNTAFAQRLSNHTASPDLNARIGAAIMGALPANAFESPFMHHSSWLARLSSIATEMETLVDEFLADGMPTSRSKLRSICRSADGR